MSMCSIEADIVKAKENLRNALGERYLDYMQSMKKWFAGKTSKQEFDREAREIVTDNNVHLHNAFLLCIITKCNNFDSIATEAATAPKTIFPLTSTSSLSSSLINTPKKANKPKKKSKTGENSSSSKPMYHLRFVPVDPIKHGRMLVAAVDFSLQSVDIKAVFLLAEATIFMLKNILTKLVSRSKFKHQVRSKAVYDLYEKNCISDKKLLEMHKKRINSNKNNQFEIDSELINILKGDINDFEEIDALLESNNTKSKNEHKEFEAEENKSELDFISNDLTNIMNVPVKRLPINLFDLKMLLQIDKSLMPSHSVRTVFMERTICNLYHEDDDDNDDDDENDE